MRPNCASAPVAYTTPHPFPALTIVPMNARLTESVSATPCLVGSEDFSAAVDSPVRMLSLHSRPDTSIRRRSAGTTSPTASRTTSPGTKAVTSTVSKSPSRRTTAVWWRLECNCAAVRSARYSLKKPSPTLAKRITPMMTACVRSPRKNDNTAVAAKSTRRALRSCRPSTARALTPCVRTAFGPYFSSRAAASVRESPSVELSSQRSTSSKASEATAPAVLP
jgi:hypothetical protein